MQVARFGDVQCASPREWRRTWPGMRWRRGRGPAARAPRPAQAAAAAAASWGIMVRARIQSNTCSTAGLARARGRWARCRSACTSAAHPSRIGTAAVSAIASSDPHRPGRAASPAARAQTRRRPPHHPGCTSHMHSVVWCGAVWCGVVHQQRDGGVVVVVEAGELVAVAAAPPIHLTAALHHSPHIQPQRAHVGAVVVWA